MKDDCIVWGLSNSKAAVNWDGRASEGNSGRWEVERRRSGPLRQRSWRCLSDIQEEMSSGW